MVGKTKRKEDISIVRENREGEGGKTVEKKGKKRKEEKRKGRKKG